MDEPILLSATQRVTDSSGARDFGLYGAQPDTQVAFRPASNEGAASDLAPVSGGASAAPSAAPEGLIASAFRSSEAPVVTGEGASAASSPTAFRPGEPGFEPLQPSSSGSSTAPAAPEALAPAVPPALASSPAEEPASIASSPVTSEPVATSAAAGGLDALPAAAQPVSTVVGGVGETAGDLTQDLLGSDPAAGLATLVALVSTADIFDLKQAGIEPVTTTIDPAMTMLDQLVADPLAPVLPGDEAEDAAAAAADPLGAVTEGESAAPPLPLPVPTPALDPLTDPAGDGGLLGL
jgi:hypothetical protein